jgi:hypothetical protein
MAEIPIQQKQKRNILPLIIGAIALLALLGWCMSRNNTSGVADTSAAAVSAPVDTGMGTTGAAGAGTTGGTTGAGTTGGTTGGAGTTP